MLCKPVLQDMSMDRTWHPILIRFGENTLKSFKQRSEFDPQLARHDIFCVGLWGRVGPPRRRCKRNLCNRQGLCRSRKDGFRRSDASLAGDRLRRKGPVPVCSRAG